MQMERAFDFNILINPSITISLTSEGLMRWMAYDLLSSHIRATQAYVGSLWRCVPLFTSLMKYTFGYIQSCKPL